MSQNKSEGESGMNFRAIPAFFALLLAPLFLAAGCATAADSPQQQRVVAIGDLHGDYDAFKALLMEAELINNRGRWIGGETIFVQTGDVPDRGPDTRKIIEHLRKLQKQAPRKGGRVVTLIGNHEAMNITGDLRYVHPGEYEAFANRNSERVREATYEANRDMLEAFYLEQDATLSSDAIKTKWFEDTPLGKLEHQAAWRPDGDIGEWVAANPAMAIIGDSLFVHAGVSEKYTAYTIDDINAMTAEGLETRSIDENNIINDPLGPLWYRGNVREREPAEEAPNETPLLSQEDELNLVLHTFGVQRIIVGHTPSLEGVKASFDGKVIQIDTGISAYYGGTQSYLEIKDGDLYAHDNGVVTKIAHDSEAGETP